MAHKQSELHFELDWPVPKPLATHGHAPPTRRLLSIYLGVSVEVEGEGRRGCLSFCVYRGGGSSLHVTITYCLAWLTAYQPPHMGTESSHSSHWNFTPSNLPHVGQVVFGLGNSLECKTDLSL